MIKGYIAIYICIVSTLWANDLVSQLRYIDTLSGEFSLQSIDEDGLVIADSRGSFAIKRPNFIYWQEVKPNERLIVSDGHWLWIDEPQIHQVQKRLLENSSQLFSMLSWFTNPETLEQTYWITSSDSSSSSKQMYQLTPKQDSPIKALSIKMEKGVYEIISYDHLDMQSKLKLYLDDQVVELDRFNFVPDSNRDILEF